MSIRFGRSGNGYDSSQVMKTADDDWRQITDLAERRKIQNRLAQRNYRRKLRQRLEELERQAGETSSVLSAAPKSDKQSKATSLQSSGRVTKRIRANSARTIRTNPEEWRLQVPRTQSAEPRSATTVSDDSPITPTTVNGESASFPFPPPSRPKSGTRNYYGGDFGPLFITEPRPSHAAAGCSQPSIWESRPTIQHSDPYFESSLRLDMSTATHPIGAYSPELFAELPALPSTYSANPTMNPNPLHLNPPMSRDHFYLTVNYNKMMNAAMQVGKILNVDEGEMHREESLSPFNKPEPWSLPENTEDLQPTQRQLAVPHHPYVDVIPFCGYRDHLLDYAEESERTGDYRDESSMCTGMFEGWGVWGEAPWESRSYESGEDFIREWWFLVDGEMMRSTNFWRRTRGLKPVDLKRIVREALEEIKKLDDGDEEGATPRARAYQRFKQRRERRENEREMGRILGEIL